MNDLDLLAWIKQEYGNNPDFMPKYVVLGDGAVYFYRKEEDKYALCEQTPSIQERV